MGYSSSQIDSAAKMLQAALPGLNYDVAKAWVTSEQGVNNNVLGVTNPANHSLYSYSSMQSGINAAANLVKSSSNYAGIRAVLGTTSQQEAAAIVNSPWNAPSHYKSTTYAGGLRAIAGSGGGAPGGTGTPGGTPISGISLPNPLDPASAVNKFVAGLVPDITAPFYFIGVVIVGTVIILAGALIVLKTNNAVPSSATIIPRLPSTAET